MASISPHVLTWSIFFVLQTPSIFQLGMHIRLHVFSASHPRFVLPTFSIVRHKTSSRLCRLIRLTAGYDTVPVLYFRQLLRHFVTAPRSTASWWWHRRHPRSQHLDITSIAQRSCFRFKILPWMRTCRGVLPLILEWPFILFSPLFPFGKIAHSFSFPSCTFTTGFLPPHFHHWPNPESLGYFHFLNMVSAEAAALQKFLQASILWIAFRFAFLFHQNLMNQYFCSLMIGSDSWNIFSHICRGDKAFDSWIPPAAPLNLFSCDTNPHCSVSAKTLFLLYRKLIQHCKSDGGRQRFHFDIGLLHIYPSW